MIKSSLWQACGALLMRDLCLAWRAPTDILNALLFFIIVVSLFPLAIGPDPQQLKLMASGIIWVAALLAMLLSLDRLFREDYQDGTLEHLLLSPHPLSLLVLIKVLTHWLIVGLPLIILSPILGVLLQLPFAAIKILMISLLLGTPTLSLIGAIGAALTVGLRNSNVLLALLILPLLIPILIFGASAVTLNLIGLSSVGSLMWLSVCLILAISLAPVVIAAGLRLGSY